MGITIFIGSLFSWSEYAKGVSCGTYLSWFSDATCSKEVPSEPATCLLSRLYYLKRAIAILASVNCDKREISQMTIFHLPQKLVLAASISG